MAAGEVVINAASLSFLARNAASLGRQRGDALYTCVQTSGVDYNILLQISYITIIIWAEKFGRICVVLSNESPGFAFSTPDLGDPRK